eukprot:5766945-Prymnesium_polylepis.2
MMKPRVFGAALARALMVRCTLWATRWTYAAAYLRRVSNRDRFARASRLTDDVRTPVRTVGLRGRRA